MYFDMELKDFRYLRWLSIYNYISNRTSVNMGKMFTLAPPLPLLVNDNIVYEQPLKIKLSRYSLVIADNFTFLKEMESIIYHLYIPTKGRDRKFTPL